MSDYEATAYLSLEKLKVSHACNLKQKLSSYKQGLDDQP